MKNEIKSDRRSASSYIDIYRPKKIKIKITKKGANMPLIEVHLLEGRTDDQKKALLSALTKAVQDSIGAPLDTIRIWIQEFSPKEYMAAGV
jgi:4-oxalocrotonate tautomerase